MTFIYDVAYNSIDFMPFISRANYLTKTIEFFFFFRQRIYNIKGLLQLRIFILKKYN